MSIGFGKYIDGSWAKLCVACDGYKSFIEAHWDGYYDSHCRQCRMTQSEIDATTAAIAAVYSSEHPPETIPPDDEE